MLAPTTTRHAFTLAVHPVSEGFGWVLFEGPFAPYLWRTSTTRTDKNAKCLRKVERLIERYQPETLVLEAFEGAQSLRSDRIKRLGHALIALARDRGVDVAIYTRAQVRWVFKDVGAVSRHEIAEAVVRHVDAFRHRLPPKRQLWKHEDPRIALFVAASLVLTHYRLDAEQVLRELAE